MVNKLYNKFNKWNEQLFNIYYWLNCDIVFYFENLDFSDDLATKTLLFLSELSDSSSDLSKGGCLLTELAFFVLVDLYAVSNNNVFLGSS